MVKKGRPVSTEKPRYLQVCLNNVLYQKLKDEATRQSVGMSTILKQLAFKQLQQNGGINL